MIIAFWISLLLVAYTFVGYGIVLYLLVRIKRLFKKPVSPVYRFDELPSCTVIVAAYNEEDFIEVKIENTLQLNYPPNKLKFLFVTDGSTDRTPELVASHAAITLLHSPERKGKIAAVHRAISQVNTEIIVFTDANTLLNADALVNICRHYADTRVGAVAGEKRVQVDETADATAGEGFYWRYESKLKNWDSELWSVVGAAGELFSVRTNLYEAVSPNSILDDFMISMRIAQKGYRIVYEPEAYATETSSANIKEELKRKVRIAAGGNTVRYLAGKVAEPFLYAVAELPVCKPPGVAMDHYTFPAGSYADIEYPYCTAYLQCFLYHTAGRTSHVLSRCNFRLVA